jgi:hypothetical protein
LICGARGHDLAIPDYDDSLQSPGEASNRHPDEFQLLRRICVAMLGTLMGQDYLLDILRSHAYTMISCFESESDVVSALRSVSGSDRSLFPPRMQNVRWFEHSPLVAFG